MRKEVYNSIGSSNQCGREESIYTNDGRVEDDRLSNSRHTNHYWDQVESFGHEEIKQTSDSPYNCPNPDAWFHGSVVKEYPAQNESDQVATCKESWVLKYVPREVFEVES